MNIKIKKSSNTLIIKLPQNYDILVEGEIINLTKKSDEFLNIKNIIIDCSSLKSLESFGGEFFILEDIVINPQKGELLFVGLKNNIKVFFNEFIKRWDKKGVINFETLDAAFRYINSK